MSDFRAKFTPRAPLLPGAADPFCRACVTVPARNEEGSLSRCLDALEAQLDLQGRPLPVRSYEVLLLLNNCTDASLSVAKLWQAEHPSMTLHVLECLLNGEEAHVGTARRMLMDTAWQRLRGTALSPVAILSTDADTVVAPDWIARNLLALECGADVVGGSVSLLAADLACLPLPVRRCYEQDRHYAGLVARLEDALDPQPGDRCPRHLDHFGSSLACTPEAYAAAGGMPAVSPLEDEAFVDRARRGNLALRHDPAVRVFTSGRLDGRAKVGMASQLRLWEQLGGGNAHLVPAAAFLEHRFRTLHQLRRIFETKDVGELHLRTGWWRETFRDAFRNEATHPGFLGAVYCDVLIAETFAGAREEPIEEAIRGLEARLRGVESKAEDAGEAVRMPAQEMEEFSALAAS